MNLITSIVSISALLILILSLINFRLSIAFYLAYIVLVPFLDVSFWGINLSYNLFNLIFLLIFLFHYKIKKNIKLDFHPIKPLLLLMFPLLFLTLFQTDTPLGFQLNVFRADFMKSFILPLIIWNVVLNDKKSLNYFLWSLIISIGISTIYGIFLTQLSGVNPYLISVLPLNGSEFDTETMISRGQGRLFGYIQSTFGHPMTYGLFLALSLVLFIGVKIKTEKKLYWIIISLIIINMIICGVRSTILASLIGLIYYIFAIKKFKLLIITTLFTLISYIIIINNSELSNILSVFIEGGANNSTIKGSSIELRMSQLFGSFDEIKYCFLQGKGYGWNGYYMIQNGAHPVLLGFESLVFIIFTNSGLIGIFLWIGFIYAVLNTNRKILLNRNHILIIDVLLITYIAFACFTGEYGYMRIFMIFYVLMLAFLMKKNHFSN